MIWNKKEDDKGLPDMTEMTTFSGQSAPKDTQDAHEDENSDIKKAVEEEKFKAVEHESSDDDMKPSISMMSSNENEDNPNSSLLYTQTIPVQPSGVKEIEEESEPMPKPVPRPMPQAPKPKVVVIPPKPRPVEPRPEPQISRPITRSVMYSAPMTQKQQVQPAVKKPAENIFIKIEKFYSAKKSLESAKKQLEEIEDMLNKIRETKMREEQELDGWEKELMHAKSYIQEVNDTVFDKLE